MGNFAALEARTAAAVFRHLANVDALLIETDLTVTGIFDNAHTVGNVGLAGMASTQPSFLCPTASLPPRILGWFAYFHHPRDPLELQIRIAGTDYAVVAVEPDGTGLTRLLLERAA